MTPREQRTKLFEIEAQDAESPFVLISTAPTGDQLSDVHKLWMFRELFEASDDLNDLVGLAMQAVDRAMNLMSEEQKAEFVKFAEPA